MLKPNSRVKALAAQLKKKYSEEKGGPLAEALVSRWQALCATQEAYPEALRRHLKNNIFPAMAVFDVLIQDGQSRQEAAAVTDELFSACMESAANMIRGLLKIPGLYRILPRIWKSAAFKLFSPEAGFEATVYDTPKSRVRFDMTSCPYYQTCRDLGCPEIAFTFCHTDDICYGNMHRKLKWNRTKTIARGGDCCDFDLSVEK